jgi:hypothetical protein
MKRLVMPITAALLLGVMPVAAHETGVVKVGSKQVGAGGEVTVRGEKLPKSATMRLELRGALKAFQLGEIKTDAKGEFETNIVVPETTELGNYKLVVLASDGDVTARADLVILAAAPKPTAVDHAKMHGTASEPEATDAMMALPLAFSTIEVALIGTFVLAAIAGGLALLRRPRARVRS